MPAEVAGPTMGEQLVPRKKQGASSAQFNEIRTCANCGARLTSAGRRSSRGIYYCATKPECVRAKQRDRYRRVAEVDSREDAPTTCRCCGAALTPRKVRFGDSPLGRWCYRARCQREKRLVAAAPTVPHNAEKITAFVEAIGVPENIVLCPECGLVDAVRGFVHPVNDHGIPKPCDGVGTEGVSRSLAELRWPERFGKRRRPDTLES